MFTGDSSNEALDHTKQLMTLKSGAAVESVREVGLRKVSIRLQEFVFSNVSSSILASLICT